MHIRKTLSGLMTLAVFAVGGVMVAADPAFAKTDMDQLTIGGEARIRYEFRNNTSFNSVAGKESAGRHRIRGDIGDDLYPGVGLFSEMSGGSGCGAGRECFSALPRGIRETRR